MTVAATVAVLQQLSAEVDELGKLKAKIAVLEEREKEITERLKASGLKVIEGKLFDAVISTFEKSVIDRPLLETYVNINMFLKTQEQTRLNINKRKAR